MYSNVLVRCGANTDWLGDEMPRDHVHVWATPAQVTHTG